MPRWSSTNSKGVRLRLEAVLATHHHADHTGGIRELKERTDATIFGPDRERIPLVDHLAQDGQVLQFGPHRVQVISTPGHTRTSVCYHTPGLLWTGDTLFQGGCGRLLECDAETMWASLQRLVPSSGGNRSPLRHDYARENYAFALSIDPANGDIAEALTQAEQANPPSTIGHERLTNIFLLSGCERIKENLGAALASPAHVFSLLRSRKDRF